MNAKAQAATSKAVDVKLPADIFDVALNVALIHQVVVAQQAAARQGTHSTRTRGETSGGGRKPHRQKGTGRARQGSTRAPQFTGGGVVHGPKPRNYDQRTPKKMKVAALRQALSDRARGGALHVLSDLGIETIPSTKTARLTLEAVCGPLTANRHKALVVLARSERTEWLSLRNLRNVHVVAVDQLNTYDVVVADHIFFTANSFDEFLALQSQKRVRLVQGAAQTSPHRHLLETEQHSAGHTASEALTKAHEMAKSRKGITSHRSQDPTIDGWSISSQEVEFVAVERHSDHVMVTWPTTMTANDAIDYFQNLPLLVFVVYVDADEYLEKQAPTSADWTRIHHLTGIKFLRVDLDGEVLMWEGPPSGETLHDNRFVMVERRLMASRLRELLASTTDRDVQGLLAQLLGKKPLNLEPLDATA